MTEMGTEYQEQLIVRGAVIYAVKRYVKKLKQEIKKARFLWVFSLWYLSLVILELVLPNINQEILAIDQNFYAYLPLFSLAIPLLCFRICFYLDLPRNYQSPISAVVSLFFFFFILYWLCVELLFGVVYIESLKGTIQSVQVTRNIFTWAIFACFLQLLFDCFFVFPRQKGRWLMVDDKTYDLQFGHYAFYSFLVGHDFFLLSDEHEGKTSLVVDILGRKISILTVDFVWRMRAESLIKYSYKLGPKSFIQEIEENLEEEICEGFSHEFKIENGEPTVIVNSTENLVGAIFRTDDEYRQMIQVDVEVGEKKLANKFVKWKEKK